MEQSHGKCLKKQLEISEALSEVQEELLHNHIQLRVKYDQLEAEVKDLRHIVDAMLERRVYDLAAQSVE